MSGLFIRNAARADAPALARVKVESWTAAYGESHPRPDMNQRDQEAHFAELLGASGESLRIILAVCRTDGEIVGYARCGPPRGTDKAESVCEAELYSIFVLPSAQNQGAGRLLLTESARACRRLGLDSLVLHTPADSAARGFYEALGGRDQGVSARQYPDGELMVRTYVWDTRIDLATFSTQTGADHG